MNQSIITVVVPMYNVEKYVGKCIETILNQTLQDIQVIFIDDCSSDATYEIVHQLTKDDSRVVLLKNPYNVGAARTRNIGKHLANSKYIAFLDADDYFELDFLETMVKECESYNLDVVTCSFYKKDEKTGTEMVVGGSECSGSMIDYSRVYDPVNDLPFVFNLCSAVPFNRVIRLEYIREKEIDFQDIPNSNDTYFALSILALSKRYKHINTPFIHYRYRMDGSISSTRANRPFYIYYAFVKFKKRLEKENLFYSYKKCFHSFVMLQISIYLLMYTDEKKSNLITFLRKEGLKCLGMDNLSQEDFLSYVSYYKWRKIISENNIDSSNNIPSFLNALKGKKIGIWGYGVIGHDFMDIAKANNIEVSIIYDMNPDKWGHSENTVVKGFDADDDVDVIVITTNSYFREIKPIIANSSKEYKIINFAAYVQFGDVGLNAI